MRGGGGEVALPAQEGPPRAPARVVLISIAGLTPADVAGAPDAPPGMPATARLGAEGVVAEGMRPASPATTYPAHATLVTGRSPARHGVVADRLLGDRGGERRRATPRSPLRAPALWDAVAESGRRSVALGWPASSGARIDAVFPEPFVLAPGEDWPAWMAAHTSPALLDAARRLGAEDPAVAWPGPERDRVLAGLACEALASEAPPALLLVHLSGPGPALATEGRGSAAARASFAAADAEVARILACLRTEKFLDSSAVLVVGDHGVTDVHKTVSPNVLLREVGLLVSPPDGRGIQRWSAYVRSNGTSAFVYARNETDARLARRALVGLAERTGGFRVLSAKEMLDAGADPEAWFGLQATEGFWIDDATDSALVGPAPVRGGWGAVAGEDVAFVAWGRGVQSGLRIPMLRQEDVAPTVAVLLGFETAPLDGRPLAGALSLPNVAAVGSEGGNE